MENASKALLMAGGILIALLVIGALVLLFSNLQDYQMKNDASMEQSEIADFNNQFEPYNKKNLTLMELKSVYNKIISNNEKHPEYRIDSNVIKSPGALTKNGNSIFEYYLYNTNFKNIDEAHKQKKVFECIKIEYGGKGGRISVINFKDVTEDSVESTLVYD